MKYRVIFAILAGTCMLASQVSGEVLRWSLQEGQSYEVKVMRNTKTNITAGEDKQEKSVAFQITLDWKVKEAKDGVFTIEETIKRLQIKVGDGVRELDLDTDKPDSELRFAARMLAARPLIGKELTLKMNTRGQTIEHKASPEFEEALKKSPSGGYVDRHWAIDFFEILLPDQEVKPGSRWNHVTKSEDGEAERIFQLVAVKDAMAKITTTEKNNSKIPGARIIKATYSQTSQFNRRRGYLSRSDTRKHLVMESTKNDQQLHVETTEQGITQLKVVP